MIEKLREDLILAPNGIEILESISANLQCLKKIDGFMCHQINKPRYSLTPSEQQIIKKISLYGNAINRKTGKFSRNQTTLITSIWKNA